MYKIMLSLLEKHFRLNEPSQTGSIRNDFSELEWYSKLIIWEVWPFIILEVSI
jgi:hypothetical protein